LYPKNDVPIQTTYYIDFVVVGMETGNGYWWKKKVKKDL